MLLNVQSSMGESEVATVHPFVCLRFAFCRRILWQHGTWQASARQPAVWNSSTLCKSLSSFGAVLYPYQPEKMPVWNWIKVHLQRVLMCVAVDTLFVAGNLGGLGEYGGTFKVTNRHLKWICVIWDPLAHAALAHLCWNEGWYGIESVSCYLPHAPNPPEVKPRKSSACLYFLSLR